MDPITIATYIILALFLFLAGFVDSIAGGGGLISLPAYMLTGIPAHNVIGTNKLSSFLGTSISTFKYWRKGYIPIALAIVGIIFAICGSSIGSNLALIVDDSVLKIFLLIALPITAIFIFVTKLKDSDKDEISGKKEFIILGLISLVIGVYDGFYGPGTGTFLILCFTTFLHMSVQKANGVSKAINLASNCGSLVVFLFNGTTIIWMGLFGAVFNILGNYVGSKCFIKNGTKIVRPIMILVLVILFVKTVFELIA